MRDIKKIQQRKNETKERKKTTTITTYDHYIVSGIGNYLSFRINENRKKCEIVVVLQAKRGKH